QKLLLFAGMTGFLIAAVAVPHAFDETGALFGFGYLVVIIVHLLLFTQADVLAGVLRLAPFNIASALLILGAGFVHGPLVYVLWVVALALQAIAPYMAPDRSRKGVATSFRVSAAHFVERHGLLVIVALGESVIAIGMGVDIEHITIATVGVIVLALVLPAALFWTYFIDAAAAEHALAGANAEARSLLAIRAYFFAHIPVLLGIVFAAAGIHAAIAHPGERAGLPEATALAGGVSLFLLGVAEVRRSLGIGSAVGRAMAAAAVLATIPVGTAASAGLQLVLVVGVVVAMLAMRPAPRATTTATEAA
ncbi:MAG TPA: low temperature requirement protein A, partial [Gemmatimonadaceae bacterium]|nr:low temperature requirement protein A [Gemmatimonadaceae bacterium]